MTTITISVCWFCWPLVIKNVSWISIWQSRFKNQQRYIYTNIYVCLLSSGKLYIVYCWGNISLHLVFLSCLLPCVLLFFLGNWGKSTKYPKHGGWLYCDLGAEQTRMNEDNNNDIWWCACGSYAQWATKLAGTYRLGLPLFVNSDVNKFLVGQEADLNTGRTLLVNFLPFP